MYPFLPPSLVLTSVLPLALLAISSVDAAGHKYASELYHNSQHHKRADAMKAGNHWTRDLLPGTANRSSVRRNNQQRRALSKGSLTEAEGCTQFYTVKKGDSCYSAIATVPGGLSLEEFYRLNPQVDGDCFNLWQGYDYCVSRVKQTETAQPAVKKIAKVKVAVKQVEKKLTTTTTEAAASTTEAATPRATPSPSPEPAVEEEDDEECDTDDVQAPAATTSSKPAEEKKVEQTTQAPAPSTTEAPAATTTEAPKTVQANVVHTSKAAEAEASPAPSSSGGSDLLSRLGVTGFLGKNTGIGSWFHTNLGSDSTNGNSWCGCPYNDDTPGFAPSVGTMLRNFGNDWKKAGSAYCGLEAVFTNPKNGMKTTLYVADGFDDAWVLTPGSVDIVFNHFANLFGSTTHNKNDVIQDLEWEFTGNRRNDLLFEQCKGYVPIDKIGFTK